MHLLRYQVHKLLYVNGEIGISVVSNTGYIRPKRILNKAGKYWRNSITNFANTFSIIVYTYGRGELTPKFVLITYTLPTIILLGF